MNRVLRSVLASSVLVAVAACGSSNEAAPLDSSRVALAARSNLHDNLGRFAAAARFLEESGLLRGLVPATGCAPVLDDDLGDDDCFDLDFTSDVAALGAWLETRIFADGNLESATATELTYRLRGAVTCDAEDDACRSLLDSVAIRLRVTSPAEGDLVVAVDVNGHRPLRVELLRTRLSLETDLAALLRALDALDHAPQSAGGASRPFALRHGGEDDDDVLAMSGRLKVSVSSLSNDRFELRVSALTPIRLDALGEEGISFSMAQADPAVVSVMDATARTVTVTSSVGAIDLSGDASAFFGGEEEECFQGPDGEIDCSSGGGAPIEGRIAFHVGGVEGTTTIRVQDGADTFSLLGFGLGNETSAVYLDGAPLFTLDVNEHTGRHVDLTLGQGDDGFATLRVSPSLEIALGVQLANLAHQVEVPDWALDERLVVRLDGAAAPELRMRLAEEVSPPSVDGEEPLPPGGGETALEVIAGTLTLESRNRAPVTVAAGMCLYGDDLSFDDETATPHPFDGARADVCE